MKTDPDNQDMIQQLLNDAGRAKLRDMSELNVQICQKPGHFPHQCYEINEPRRDYSRLHRDYNSKFNRDQNSRFNRDQPVAAFKDESYLDYRDQMNDDEININKIALLNNDNMNNNLIKYDIMEGKFKNK